MIVTDIIFLDKKRDKVYIDDEFAFVLYKGELRTYGICEEKKLTEDAHGYDYKDCYICDKNGCWEVTKQGEKVGTFSTDKEAEEFIDNK